MIVVVASDNRALEVLQKILNIEFCTFEQVLKPDSMSFAACLYISGADHSKISMLHQINPSLRVYNIVPIANRNGVTNFSLPVDKEILLTFLIKDIEIHQLQKQTITLQHKLEQAQKTASMYESEVTTLIADLQYHSIALDQITSISKAILSTDDPKKLFTLIALYAKKITDSGNAVIILYDEYKKFDVVFTEEYIPAANIQKLLSMETIFKRVFESGITIKINPSDKQRHELELTPAIQRFLGIQLLHKEELIGILCVYDTNQVDSFKESDEFMVRALGSLAVSAQNNLHNINELKRQHDKVTRAYNELTITLKDLQYHSVIVDQIRNVSKNIYAELTLDKIITVIAEDVRNLTDSKASIVIIKTKRGSYEVFTSGMEFTEQAKRELIRSDNLYMRAILKNQTFFWDNVPITEVQLLPKEHVFLSNVIAIPVSSDSGTVGVIAVMNNSEGYKETHQYLIYALTDVTATALQNSNLLDDLHQRVHELSMLNNFSLALNSLETERIIETIGEHIMDVLPTDRMAISLASYNVETHRLVYRFIAYRNNVSEGFLTLLHPDIISPLSEALVTKQAIIVNTTEAGKIYDSLPLENSGYFESIGSCLAAPILADGKVNGFLIAVSGDEYVFQENNRHLLTIMANQISIALVNADLFENLKEKVRERVAELDKKNIELERSYRELQQTQSQLIQSERMNAIGMMVAGVMHEINNPTAAIAAAAESALQNVNSARDYFLGLIDPNDRESHEVTMLTEMLSSMEDTLKIAINGTERVAGIVATLRSFNKHQEAEQQVGELSKELQATIKLFRFQFKNVEVEFSASHPGEMFVAGNLGELNQVFLNLCVNAAQAGATLLHISINKIEQHVIVRIQDNGGGIPEEIQSKIFEPFFSTKGAGNSGLGLHLSKQILERHNAEILLESEIGKGTTFIITFPLVEPEETIL